MGAESLTYEYDAGLVTSQTLKGTLGQTLSGDFTIIRNSLPESVTNGKLNVTGTFNGYGEVSSQGTTVNGSSLLSYSLERDNTGRITRKTETLAGTTAVFNYTYDTMGRLLTVTKDGSLVEDYQYNANGARISETNTLRDITNRPFEYTAEDRLRLVRAGTVTYTHDADGFLTSKTDEEKVTAYTYAIRGELLNVTLSNGDVIEYVHDPLGRRIAKKINGTTTEKYLWQGLTRLLAVYDGSGSLAMRFAYADGRLPVAMTRNGATYYPVFDQARPLKAFADASGNVVKQVDYDTFGNVINDTAPEFTVLLGFAGGLYDPDGLIKQFLFNQFINQSVKSISYAYLDIEPAGRRIFSTGIGGGVSGAVGGAISGSTIGGIGAVPGALVGSVAGFGGGVIVQSFLEAAGVGQVIEDLFNEMKDNLRDLFIGNDDSGLCP